MPLIARQLGGSIPPPPGVVPDFVHPVSHASRIVIINIVFCVMAGVMVLLRLYTRLCVTHSIGYDDCRFPTFLTSLLGFLLTSRKIDSCLIAMVGRALGQDSIMILTGLDVAPLNCLRGGQYPE